MRMTSQWLTRCALVTLLVATALSHGSASAAKPRALTFRTHPDGYITAWLLGGGFRRGRSKRRAFFERDLLGAEASVDPIEGDRIGPRSRKRWKLHVSTWRKTNLKGRLSPRYRSAGYAFARLVVPSARDAFLLVGSDDGVRVWLNGKLVSDRYVVRKHRYDNELIPISLSAGVNRLLLKVDQGGGRWLVSARVVDRSGAVMRDLRVEQRVNKGGRERVRSTLRRALRTRLELALRRAGSTATAHVELTSGPPELAGPITFELEVGKERKVRTLSLERFQREPVRISVPLKVGGRAKARLRIADGVGSLYTRRFSRRLPRHLVKRAFAAESNLARADASQVSQGSIDSTAYVLQRGRELLEDGDGDWRYIGSLLRQADRHARLLAKGKDPYRRKRQAFYRAYRSPFDGKLQHYATYVPSSYSKRRKYPLVVALHGFQSTTMITLRRALGSSITLLSYADGDRKVPRFKEKRFLVAAPRGYGNIAYRYIAEDDILRVIEEMKKAYNVDESRIYLTGLSMGGLGTMEVGFHFPSKWAGLISNCGAADTRMYESIRGYTPKEWETDLIDGRSAVLWAENGLHLPFTIAHGRKDRINHWSNSYVLVKEYKRLGYRVRWRLDEDLGHNVWDRTWEKGKIWTRYLRYQRDRFPKRFIFKSAHYRYMKAYWITFEEFDRLWKFARVDARMKRKQNRIELKTENLLRFVIDVSAMDSSKPLVVDVDGTVVHQGPWDGKPMRIGREGTGSPWRVFAGSASRSGKRPGLSGPIEDFKYVRQLIVYGTQDPEEEYVLRRAALEAADYHSHSGIRLAVKRDVDVTAEDLRTSHLHLFGTPRSNLWLRKVEKDLPIRVLPDGVQVGAKRYRGADLGFKMIYPNPLAPENYLMVSAGVNAQMAKAANHLPLWAPDYMVFNLETVTPHGNKILEGRPAVAAGYFDKQWKLTRTSSTGAQSASSRP